MSHILDLDLKAEFPTEITSYEFHSHVPFSSQTFAKNDEIRIVVNQLDVYTLPGESYLLLEGEIKIAGGETLAHITLQPNAGAYLFDSIRYEVSGIDVDSSKSVGVATTIKDYMMLSQNDLSSISHTGFYIADKAATAAASKKFVFCLPLKRLLSIFETYNKILLNVRQELILLRSSTDADALLLVDAGATKTSFSISIDKITWKMPYIKVNELTKLKLLKRINSDRPIIIPFHKWELHESINIPQTDHYVWSIKTTTHANKPKFAIIGFQMGNRAGDMAKNSAVFDSAKVKEIKIFLNENAHPYDQVHGNAQLFYDMYCRFKETYKSGGELQQQRTPLLTFEQYKNVAPLYVINCAYHDMSVKTGSVDVKLEVSTSEAITAGTKIYCILIYDEIVSYTPLTGIVKKMF